MKSREVSRLSAYRFVALWMAGLMLIPATVFALTQGFWVGLKVFIFVGMVIQFAVAWSFRHFIAEAWRDRRQGK
jgi:spore maturation protein SpmA